MIFMKCLHLLMLIKKIYTSKKISDRIFKILDFNKSGSIDF